MRRFFFPAVIGLLTLALLPESAPAQHFRGRRIPRAAFTGVRPATPFMLQSTFNAPFNNGFITPRQAQVFAAPGTFNRATGAFVPGLTGSSAITHSSGFTPTRGTFTPTPSGAFVLATRQAFNPATRSFVPSPTGTFIKRERGDFTPAKGSFQQATTGSFNPFTGQFVPNAAGQVTLASSGAFRPSSGIFVANPQGNFAITTRAAFNPALGTFVPSPTGTFNAQVRGNFVPTRPGTFTTAIGNQFVTPVNPAAQVLAAQFNAAFTANALHQSFNPYAFNPYFANPYVAATAYNPLANPYAAMNSYGNAYANPYIPYSPPYAGSYSAPYANAGYSTQPSYDAIPQYRPSDAAPKQLSTLGAYGIPNENGAIQWPLPFRLMAPDKKQELCDPLEAQLQVVTTQAAAGSVNPQLVKQAQQNVDRLREWLRQRRLDFAEETSREGDRFLRSIEDSLKKMAKN